MTSSGVGVCGGVMSGRGAKRLGAGSVGAVCFGGLGGSAAVLRPRPWPPREGAPGRLKWMVLGRKLLGRYAAGQHSVGRLARVGVAKTNSQGAYEDGHVGLERLRRRAAVATWRDHQAESRRRFLVWQASSEGGGIVETKLGVRGSEGRRSGRALAAWRANRVALGGSRPAADRLNSRANSSATGNEPFVRSPVGAAREGRTWGLSGARWTEGRKKEGRGGFLSEGRSRSRGNTIQHCCRKIWRWCSTLT